MFEEPWRVERLQENCRFFYEALVGHGLDVGPSKGESPVIPVITGDSMQALLLSQQLLDAGINAKPIVYPAVANDSARLRFFITALHTQEELTQSAQSIAEILSSIRQGAPS
jgi:7-keto-8-aminopelargonate synthetase-like enzyme